MHCTKIGLGTCTMQWTRILHEQPGVRGVWRRWSKKAHTGTGWHLHATKDFSTVWISQEFIDVIKEMYFQLSFQRYVPWRYHLLCVGITEEIWHNRTKIQTGCSFGQFLVTDTRANMDGLLLTSWPCQSLLAIPLLPLYFHLHLFHSPVPFFGFSN